MPSLKAIKKRIASVRNTQKITRAMKLVSAAKLRRATEKVQNSRPFEKELQNIISQVLQEGEWSSPLAVQRPLKKIALVVFSTDRGLCGSLNTNLFKILLKRIQSLTTTSFEIIALGKKARDWCKRRGWTIHSSYLDLPKKGSYSEISKIAIQLRTLFVSGAFDQVEVFYPQFRSALVQKPTEVILLPFVPMKQAMDNLFLYEPTPPHLLDFLVPKFIDFQLFRFYLERVASEYGARMATMESATKNASEMISRLTLIRNRVRQAMITKELMEIIGGAEALSA